MYEKELREKKNNGITRAEEILKKAEMEKRELTDAEAQELAEIRDDIKRIKATLKAKGFFDGESMGDESRAKDKKGDGCNKRDDEADEAQELKTRAAEERALFDAYIRNTINERDATNMTKGDNGAIIPTTIAKEIIRKLYDICPILERSQKFNVKGTLEIPYYDESTQAITVGWANEFEELTSQVGKFTNVSLTGYLAGALSLISKSLVNNSEFDVVGLIVDYIAYSWKRWLENVLLNGSGSVAGLTGVTKVTTAAAQTAITADEVIELKDSVKDMFQNNAIWIMSPATRTALRLLKDDVGRYLLQDDITAPFGATLLGKPIYVSDNMADMAAGATAIYYGDMTGLATKFNENLEIMVLREKFATQHAIGVVSYSEFDAKIIDAQKIAALKMASA